MPSMPSEKHRGRKLHVCHAVRQNTHSLISLCAELLSARCHVCLSVLDNGCFLEVLMYFPQGTLVTFTVMKTNGDYEEIMKRLKDFQSPVHTRESTDHLLSFRLAGLLVASKPRCLHKDDYEGARGDGLRENKVKHALLKRIIRVKALL